MSGWGFAGPVLCPFEAIHVTYKEHTRCIACAGSSDELELGFHEDLPVHDGKYSGDFEICAGGSPEGGPARLTIARIRNASARKHESTNSFYLRSFVLSV